MKHLMFLPALAVAAVVLAACERPDEFSFPISEPGLASYDERLLGTWYIISGDAGDAGGATLTVTPGKDGFLDVAGVAVNTDMGSYNNQWTEDREAGAGFTWMRWTAHASVIDGETYFNARLVDTADVRKETGKPPEIKKDDHFVSHPERGYWIIRAEIGEDDLLTLHVLWKGNLGVASRKVTCGKYCSFQFYDLSSEELVAAIRAAEPGEIFKPLLRFARIEGVYPSQPWD